MKTDKEILEELKGLIDDDLKVLVTAFQLSTSPEQRTRLQFTTLHMQ